MTATWTAYPGGYAWDATATRRFTVEREGSRWILSEFRSIPSDVPVSHQVLRQEVRSLTEGKRTATAYARLND